MDKISVIVPCFNEEESLPLFYDEITRVASEMSENVVFEVIIVDDGSKDKTAEIARSFSIKDERFRYISFSRNFGKEAGIYAGLQASTGDYAVVIDADLQHPPKYIKQMYNDIKTEGWDCVAMRRTSREGEPKIRSFFSRMFYKVMDKISGTEVVEGACDYRLMCRRMVDAVLSISESNRFSKGIFSWVGFKTKWLEFENVERVAGTTKWSFKKLLMYSFDGISAFSTAPLSIASFMGIIFCIIAFIWMLFYIVKTIALGDPVPGFPTLACLILFIGGIQLLMIGILGQYLAKTYMETKHRPLYIIRETEKDISKDEKFDK